MDTKWGKQREGGGGGVMNWAIGIDMYTLMCIKWMTNKKLLYRKYTYILFKSPKEKPKKLSLPGTMVEVGDESENCFSKCLQI